MTVACTAKDAVDSVSCRPCLDSGSVVKSEWFVFLRGKQYLYQVSDYLSVLLNEK